MISSRQRLERRKTMADNYSNLAKDVDKRVGALSKAAPKQMGTYNQLDTRINLHILHPRAGDGVFGCFFSGF